jgi:FkbM family methyltransferase
MSIDLNAIISFINNQNQRIVNLEHNLNKQYLHMNLIKDKSQSFSQYSQDLFVLSILNHKKNGYFIDFGATDGIFLSNSYLLERDYGWSGILAEPAKCWHNSLFLNRKSHIDTRCVWTESNQLINFIEADVAELSTISDFTSNDIHGSTRALNSNSYSVKTVSLNDLLYFYNAPSEIDYLSIDTEGSEFLILENFNFNKYKIKIITVEHNWTSNRELIHKLLTGHNYKRMHLDLTDCDDWYVLDSVAG